MSKGRENIELQSSPQEWIQRMYFLAVKKIFWRPGMQYVAFHRLFMHGSRISLFFKPQSVLKNPWEFGFYVNFHRNWSKPDSQKSANAE